MKIKILSLFLIFELISCGISNTTEQLRKEVQNEIDIELQERAKDKDITFSIKSFKLVHTNGTKYDGLLKTLEDGNENIYHVDVTFDGKSYLYKLSEN